MEIEHNYLNARQELEVCSKTDCLILSDDGAVDLTNPLLLEGARQALVNYKAPQKAEVQLEKETIEISTTTITSIIQEKYARFTVSQKEQTEQVEEAEISLVALKLCNESSYSTTSPLCAITFETAPTTTQETVVLQFLK